MNPLVQMLSPLGRMLRNKRPDVALSIRNHPAFAAPRTITLTSPAFADGGTIPDRQCSLDMGPNVSPALSWTGVPAGTEQLLFILEDIDVPMSRPALHTIALLDPGLTGLAEGEMNPANPAVHFLPATRGRRGYFGPRPLPGHGTHHYGFHLYALDRPLPTALTGLDDVAAAATGHLLADGFLEGVKRA
jgi:phosphatidylethanolamine-binding protein (PEBP) family uncharacterized protein